MLETLFKVNLAMTNNNGMMPQTNTVNPNMNQMAIDNQNLNQPMQNQMYPIGTNLPMNQTVQNQMNSGKEKY